MADAGYADAQQNYILDNEDMDLDNFEPMNYSVPINTKEISSNLPEENNSCFDPS
jgi:hypothetical protein